MRSQREICTGERKEWLTFKIGNRQEWNHQLPRRDDFSSNGIDAISPILLTDNVDALSAVFWCIYKGLRIELYAKISKYL